MRGIGRGFQVAPFTTNGHYTFGFINALVDSGGTPTATSMGAVEFDNPADGGQGQGGPATTNQWVASVSQNTVVALG